MYRRIVIPVLLLLMCAPALPAVDDSLSLVPMPMEIKLRDGGFRLTARTKIVVQYGHQSEDRIAAETLAEEISDQTGLRLEIVGMNPSGKAQEGAIVLARLQDKRVRKFLAAKGLTTDVRVGKEGYLLFSDNTHLVVAASSGQGIFYGVQTLRQLLRRSGNGAPVCPAVAIRDWPELQRPDRQDVTRETPPTFSQPLVHGPQE